MQFRGDESLRISGEVLMISPPLPASLLQMELSPLSAYSAAMTVDQGIL